MSEAEQILIHKLQQKQIALEQRIDTLELTVASLHLVVQGGYVEPTPLSEAQIDAALPQEAQAAKPRR